MLDLNENGHEYEIQKLLSQNNFYSLLEFAPYNKETNSCIIEEGFFALDEKRQLSEWVDDSIVISDFKKQLIQINFSEFKDTFYTKHKLYECISDNVNKIFSKMLTSQFINLSNSFKNEENHHELTKEQWMIAFDYANTYILFGSKINEELYSIISPQQFCSLFSFFGSQLYKDELKSKNKYYRATFRNIDIYTSYDCIYPTKGNFKKHLGGIFTRDCFVYHELLPNFSTESKINGKVNEQNYVTYTESFKASSDLQTITEYFPSIHIRNPKKGFRVLSHYS